uniref:Transmembrane protein n=1 Tax=Macrostomum lignano TaxID=282301 RepID=A0A1I8H062_9PLAT
LLSAAQGLVAELESIEAQLNRLEAWRQNQLRLQKRLLGYLLIAFLIGYPSALGVYYVYCLPVASRLTQLLHVAAFVFVLPLFYALRRFLLWIFVRSLAGCEARASRLREDKRKVLDRVMDTETYKRAKEILDRFDPDRFKADHNGMAMAEEFPHLAWRCAYCAYLHSPRQPLPNPPVLPLGEASPQPGRPQWQSLTDLRPAASTSAAGAGGEAGREDSSSSAASTPAAAARAKPRTPAR